jgi:phosphoribosyl 1,2-cyclic phosphodiesterase
VLTFSLQSGSNGNSIYVEADGVRLLFDAGIPGKTAATRMACHDRDIRRVDAVIISHDHSDHVRCAGVYHRKFNLPLYMTRRTKLAVGNVMGRLDASRVHYFNAGHPLEFGDVHVHTLPTPHDAADGVVFVVEHRGVRLGVLTDLGHPFPELKKLLPTLQAAYIESNYDPDMLRNGSYPWPLQERIRGDGGHLSNEESAELLEDVIEDWSWAALAHLSHENNHPRLALHAHQHRHGDQVPLHIASRYQVSPVLQV